MVQKESRTFWIFHCRDSGRKSSHTLSACTSGRRTIGFIIVVPPIHLSDQILIESPGPTLLIKPFTSASLPKRMARHVSELFFFLVASRKLHAEKYFPFSTLAQRESGFMIRRQPCFPGIAWLNSGRSRNPIPPSSFDLVSFDHRCQWILWLTIELQ